MAIATIDTRPSAPRIFPCDVIIVNNFDGNFLSKAIRFFGKSWSHTANGWFDIVHSGIASQTVFEANLLIGPTDWETTFNDPDYDIRVYQWVNHTKKMDEVAWELYKRYNADSYGAGQLLWFIWRWMVEGLHLPARWARKNFIPNSEVCTEVVYMGFKLLEDPVVNSVLARLNRNQDTVNPGDIIWVCEELIKLGLMKRTYNRERAK